MRRLVVEVPKEDIRRIEGEERDPFRNIKSMEILHYLRQDKREFSLLCRIVLKDPSAEGVKQVLSRNQNLTAQVLEREKSGAYIIFIKGILGKASSSGVSFLRVGGAYLVAFELNSELIRMTYLGDHFQVKKTLQKLEAAKLRIKVLSLTDAKFSSDSPLNALTEKQREVITEAFRLGYYSIPRKISSEQLARKLNIHGSALIAHRRKAELRLLGKLLLSNDSSY